MARKKEYAAIALPKAEPTAQDMKTLQGYANDRVDRAETPQPEVPIVNSQIIAEMAAKEHVEPHMLADAIINKPSKRLYYMGKEGKVFMLQSLLERINRSDQEELSFVLNGLITQLDNNKKSSCTVDFSWSSQKGLFKDPFMTEGAIIMEFAIDLSSWLLTSRRDPYSRLDQISNFLEKAHNGISRAKLWQKCSAELNAQELSPKDFWEKTGNITRRFRAPEQKKKEFETSQQEALEEMKEVVTIVMASLDKDGSDNRGDLQRAKYNTAEAIERWFSSHGMQLEGELSGKPPVEYLTTKGELEKTINELESKIVALQKQLQEQEASALVKTEELESKLKTQELSSESLTNQLNSAKEETAQLKEQAEKLFLSLSSQAEKKGMFGGGPEVVPMSAIEEGFLNAGFIKNTKH